jgi:hypothetical protein
MGAHENKLEVLFSQNVQSLDRPPEDVWILLDALYSHDPSILRTARDNNLINLSDLANSINLDSARKTLLNLIQQYIVDLCTLGSSQKEFLHMSRAFYSQALIADSLRVEYFKISNIFMDNAKKHGEIPESYQKQITRVNNELSFIGSITRLLKKAANQSLKRTG